MFIDEVTIRTVGGPGGNGCVSFRREKYIPRGGPNGGDGGHGGSVVLVADLDVQTLLAFRYQPLYRAERGRHGEGSNRTGRSGSDLEVRVPVGTLVLDEDAVSRLADLDTPGSRFVACGGGRGGRGNARFVGPVNRAPTRADPGEPGDERSLRLELKLLADVGLVGFPNAGKSTLISRISAARPKIADYPFTTLAPHLGVVDGGGYRSFVVADIPGLIEGAHSGAGLGTRFLRHVERCRLLLHLVDPVSHERDPIEGIDAIRHELAEYGHGLEDKHEILVVTKADASPNAETVDRLTERAQRLGLDLILISSVSGEGLPELIRMVLERLDRIEDLA